MPKKRFSAEQTRATRGTISLQHPHSWHSRAGGGAVHSIISGLMHRSKLNLYLIASAGISVGEAAPSNIQSNIKFVISASSFFNLIFLI